MPTSAYTLALAAYRALFPDAPERTLGDHIAAHIRAPGAVVTLTHHLFLVARPARSDWDYDQLIALPDGLPVYEPDTWHIALLASPIPLRETVPQILTRAPHTSEFISWEKDFKIRWTSTRSVLRRLPPHSIPTPWRSHLTPDSAIFDSKYSPHPAS